VELSVVTGLSRHLCQQVEARTLDVAVITLPHVLPHSEILAQPTLQWVASSGFRLPEDGVWPFAFFPEGCAFRGAALRCLTEAGVPHRIALVSPSGQGIQAAVAAELAATVMAEGTLPPGLRTLAEPSSLPDLPQACIQIVTRAQGLSAAMREVKATVAETW
jgi:DNA-binding transcriptional LysR family regulator